MLHDNKEFPNLVTADIIVTVIDAAAVRSGPQCLSYWLNVREWVWADDGYRPASVTLGQIHRHVHFFLKMHKKLRISYRNNTVNYCMCELCLPSSHCPGRFCMPSKDSFLLLNNRCNDLQHLLADESHRDKTYMCSICGLSCTENAQQNAAAMPRRLHLSFWTGMIQGQNSKHWGQRKQKEMQKGSSQTNQETRESISYTRGAKKNMPTETPPRRRKSASSF